MLGPALHTRGGIAALVNAYGAHGLFARWSLRYVATDTGGGALRRLAALVRAAAVLMLLLVRERPVLLHIHGASRGFWRASLFMALALAARTRFLLHLHGGGFAGFFEDGCGRVGRALARFLFARAACIVVPTEGTQRWLRRTCAPVEVVCLPNPVDGAPLLPAGQRRSMLLYVGRPDARKGLYELLHAFSALRLQHPDATLVCAGEGDAQEPRRFCELLGIADAVVFTGWIGQDEKRVLLQRAAAFVLPGRQAGMPITLLQAMEAGVPVVAAAGSELIVHGVNGLLFAPGDVGSLRRMLCRLLHEGTLAAGLAARARSSVRVRCSADRVLAQLDSLYGSLGVRRSRSAALVAASGEAA